LPELETDVLVVGGGLGGVAAALAAARNGRRVVLTEETKWIGGQLTAQGVPFDEHPWIEQFGCTASYRRLRDEIRAYYRNWYPLTDRARTARNLNPGGALVSKLCFEPRVGVAVLAAMLAPYRAGERLRLFTRTRPVAADGDGDRVTSVTVEHADGRRLTITARYVVDATETGDLLPLADIEYVTGFESRQETGEPSAPDEAQPLNMQAITVCMAFEHRAGEDHTIDEPETYRFWRDYEPKLDPPWPGRQLSLTGSHPHTLDPHHHTFTPNPEGDPTLIVADQSKNPGSTELWLYRRLIASRQFTPGTFDSDIVLGNWPMLDYLEGPIIDVDGETAAGHLEGARQLTLSMFHWLQTEAPRPDGGTGYPGLRLRGDILGTDDGLAMAPYIRESRRIKARTTVVEQDLSLAIRGGGGAVSYPDSVGVGMYRIDLHPSTGGDNYIDVGSSPYQIPLGALLPRRVRNVLAGGKNIGTTHITNGAYRLHPTEWNAGEVAGLLAAHCVEHNLEPHQVHADTDQLATFQSRCDAQGIERVWPAVEGY
jgi:hypothetical protein